MTSTPSSNVETVRAIYAAFGRGDVGFILDQTTDDVEWDEGIRPTDLPWLRPGKGKQHVVEFFTALGGGFELSTFEPLAITCDGNHVVSVIREAGTIISTGKPVEADLMVHCWRFNAEGKVEWFRHIGDWARQEIPFRP